jgi:hypothetical protein
VAGALLLVCTPPQAHTAGTPAVLQWPTCLIGMLLPHAMLSLSQGCWENIRTVKGKCNCHCSTLDCATPVEHTCQQASLLVGGRTCCLQPKPISCCHCTIATCSSMLFSMLLSLMVVLAASGFQQAGSLPLPLQSSRQGLQVVQHVVSVQRDAQQSFY